MNKEATTPKQESKEGLAAATAQGRKLGFFALSAVFLVITVAGL